MEQLKLIEEALERGNNAGIFKLAESTAIYTSLQQLKSLINELSKPTATKEPTPKGK